MPCSLCPLDPYKRDKGFHPCPFQNSRVYKRIKTTPCSRHFLKDRLSQQSKPSISFAIKPTFHTTPDIIVTNFEMSSIANINR